jgi:hypothetical protein
MEYDDPPVPSYAQQSGRFGLELPPEYAGEVSNPSAHGTEVGEHGTSILKGPTHGEIFPIEEHNDLM